MTKFSLSALFHVSQDYISLKYVWPKRSRIQTLMYTLRPTLLESSKTQLFFMKGGNQITSFKLLYLNIYYLQLESALQWVLLHNLLSIKSVVKLLTCSSASLLLFSYNCLILLIHHKIFYYKI